MPASQEQRQTIIETWNGDIQILPCIGNGVSGLVFEIDGGRVAKVALGTARSIEDIETERKIYRRFKQMLPNSDCNYILFCLESDNPRGLVFERCKGTVRSRLRSQSPILPDAVMKWAVQAAKGLGFVHDCGVIQGDVGCHNMLLDAKDTLKVADFAGSSIDGSDASVNYEVRSRLPGISRPTEKSDIYALGSALYELATGRPPYSGESYKTVQKLYRQEKFADVSMLPDLGPIITKCWQRQYVTAWDVVDALKRVKLHRLKGRAPHPNAMAPENPAAPVSDAPDISQLAITRSLPRRDRKASTTYVPHSSQRRPSYREENEADRKTRQRGQKERRSEYSWKSKFMPWLRPVQRGLEKDYHCL